MIWQFMCKMSQKALQIFSFASPLFPKSQETLEYYFSSICNFVSSNRSSLRHHVPPLVCEPHTLTACATVPSGLLVYVVSMQLKTTLWKCLVQRNPFGRMKMIRGMILVRPRLAFSWLVAGRASNFQGRRQLNKTIKNQLGNIWLWGGWWCWWCALQCIVQHQQIGQKYLSHWLNQLVCWMVNCTNTKWRSP